MSEPSPSPRVADSPPSRPGKFSFILLGTALLAFVFYAFIK